MVEIADAHPHYGVNLVSRPSGTELPCATARGYEQAKCRIRDGCGLL